MDEAQKLIKRKADSDPVGTMQESKRFRYSLAQKTEIETTNDQQILHYAPFDDLPEEFVANLLLFLSSKDKEAFSFLSQSLNASVRTFQMCSDPRALKNKEWSHGPTLYSFENYLLNCIVWRMGHALLKGTRFQNQNFLANTGVLIKGVSFLHERFSNCRDLQSISEGFSTPAEYLNSARGKAMKNYATEKTHSAENDFLELLFYLTNPNVDYRLLEDFTQPMGLVERFHRVNAAYFKLQDPALSLEEQADIWEIILKYELNPITSDHIRTASKIYFELGKNHTDYEQKLSFFARSAQLCEIGLREMGEQAQEAFLNNGTIAYLNAGHNALDLKQKLVLYSRSTQLYELFLFLLNARGMLAEMSTVNNAASAYYYAGICDTNIAQKFSAFKRCAELRESILTQLGDQATLEDIKSAATVYFQVGMNSVDPVQKFSAFKRSAELRESILTQLGDQATLEDIKSTASAYCYASSNAADSLERLMLSKSGAQLFQTVLEKMGDQASVRDIKNTRNAYMYLAPNTPDPKQKLSFYVFLAQLNENVLEKMGDQASVRDIKNTRNAYLDLATNTTDLKQKRAFYRRSVVLAEDVLKKMGDQASAEDIKHAAYAYINIENLVTDPEERFISFERAAELHKVVLQKMNGVPDKAFTKNMVRVYFELGVNSNDPIQKLSFFGQAAQIFEEYFSLEDYSSLKALKSAITTYENLGNLSKAQELRERLSVLESDPHANL